MRGGFGEQLAVKKAYCCSCMAACKKLATNSGGEDVSESPEAQLTLNRTPLNANANLGHSCSPVE